MLPARPFYLIRHGQTVANAARVAAGGQNDTPLNEAGRLQAAALAPYLIQLDIQPEVIYHSMMSRARDTATILNTALNLEMQARYELREHDVGEFEGISWDIIEPLYEAGANPPGGETFSEFAQRIQSVFTDIFNAEPDRLPLIVAHGGVFGSLGFLYEYGIDRIQNCHLHYFEPNTAWDKFPWRVSCFDIQEDRLVKLPASFCLSHALAKIS